MKKIVVAWVASVLGVVVLVCWLGTSLVRHPSATSEGTPLISGGFDLVGTHNHPITDKDFRGRYMLVYFGYTHCPDVCPTTLLLMQNAVSNLGAAGATVQPIFITVDPERDTPSRTAAYAEHFGNTIGLSGTPAQIKEAADHYKVYYSKIPNSDPALGYMMDHSGFIYLMGPNGDYLAHFSSDTPQQALEEGIKRFVH
jgi:cytochrome oxidase Cu insertion factor (SCO1/SenC/PrrC family)